MKITIAISSIILCIMLLSACEKDEAIETTEDCLSNPVSYKDDIAPLISKYCTNGYCHSGQYTNYEGLKRAVEVGSLHTRVIDEQSMPPMEAEKITERQRMLIACWIEDGALNN